MGVQPAPVVFDQIIFRLQTFLPSAADKCCAFAVPTILIGEAAHKCMFRTSRLTPSLWDTVMPQRLDSDAVRSLALQPAVQALYPVSCLTWPSPWLSRRHQKQRPWHHQQHARCSCQPAYATGTSDNQRELLRVRDKFADYGTHG